jgi:hypothetical protein
MMKISSEQRRQNTSNDVGRWCSKLKQEKRGEIEVVAIIMSIQVCSWPFVTKDETY